MLAGNNRDARYGACEALGALGPRADAAAPQLRAALQDKDPWLQTLAAEALPALGPEARKASVSDLLAMTVRPNPADPRRMAQRSAAIALCSPTTPANAVRRASSPNRSMAWTASSFTPPCRPSCKMKTASSAVPSAKR